MNPALVVLILISVPAIAGLIVIFRNLSRTESMLPVTAEWISELSVERYQPMMRLLNSQDFEFLRKQPGYTSKTEKVLRARRCQIFRGYLNCLTREFDQVATALKVMITQSPLDRPDLGWVLMRQQAQFATTMWMVRCSLVLFQLGIGDVNVRSLLGTFDAMRLELGALAPSESKTFA